MNKLAFHVAWLHYGLVCPFYLQHMMDLLTPFVLLQYPQAFTTDFRVHWAQHPLRPEFAESTYFLYKVIYQ